ncbi:MAG: Gfo/Idh/MocA family oxidoreductase [Gammaproteobacteria bacterium]|nr:Gfo/Idh/MocA family oxidoreductase [Gammaproteobacteria bacterium]
METLNIAVVGLGRVGTVFLERILLHKSKGIEVTCVVERNETSGKASASQAGIRVASVGELIAAGNAVDIIFDLTGSTETRRELREQLAATNNRHTTIATEAIAHMMWKMMGDTDLPEHHGKGGY